MKKPPFLRFVVVAGLVLGMIGLLMCGGFLVAASAAAGPYFVNGAAASREEFMAFAVPLLGSYGVLSLIAIVVSWALAHDRAWSRTLLFALVALMVVFSLVGGVVAGIGDRQALGAAVMSALMLASLWWYLYREDRVIDYYDAIARRDRGETG